MNQKGALYVAFGHWYHFEAAQSMISLKYFNPDIETAIVIERGQSGKILDGFDFVIEVRHDPSVHPYTEKVRGLEITPFDQTIYLDGDTLIRGSISDLLTETAGDMLAICRQSDHYLNTGVFVFNKNTFHPVVTAWYERIAATDQKKLGFFHETWHSYGDQNIFNDLYDENYFDLQAKTRFLDPKKFNAKDDLLWDAIRDGTITDSIIIHAHDTPRVLREIEWPTALATSLLNVKERVYKNVAEVEHYLGSQQPVMALAASQDAIDYVPSYASAFLARAKAMLALGRRDKATADVRRALELDPSSAEAQTVLASLT